jgi:hypothetical protein
VLKLLQINVVSLLFDIVSLLVLIWRQLLESLDTTAPSRLSRFGLHWLGFLSFFAYFWARGRWVPSDNVRKTPQLCPAFSYMSPSQLLLIYSSHLHLGLPFDHFVWGVFHLIYQTSSKLVFLPSLIWNLWNDTVRENCIYFQIFVYSCCRTENVGSTICRNAVSGYQTLRRQIAGESNVKRTGQPAVQYSRYWLAVEHSSVGVPACVQSRRHVQSVNTAAASHNTWRRVTAPATESYN